MIRAARGCAVVMAAVIFPVTPVVAAPLTYQAPVVEAFPTGEAPSVSASSWIIYDESSDTVLGSLRPDERRAMASTTKIMTGLLTLERSNPSEIVTVSVRAAATGEKEIELVAGEQIEMNALFKSLMIHSANDSANAIAEHISGSVEAFVALMNLRARELGLDNTSFANTHGLDAPDHYSSARDLLEMSRLAMSLPGFADVVRSKIVVMPPDPDGVARTGATTNLMLGEYEGAAGIKTGFTSQALLTYVGVAERDGRRIYVVVLGSEGRRGHFADASLLFDYAFNDLGYFGDIALGTHYTSVKLRHTPDPLLALGNVETFMHLSNVGLTLENPRPLVALPEPESPPTLETTRRSDPAPDSVLSALGYWVTSVFGT